MTTPEALMKHELEEEACELAHNAIMDEIDSKICACKDEIIREVHVVRDDLERGFPKDKKGRVDFEGHADYHERLMAAAEAQERFWNEMRLDIAKKGAWGLLIIIIGLIIIGVQVKLGLVKTV